FGTRCIMRILAFMRCCLNTPFENFSTSYAWLGAICYSLQLFFDFSGYSDMAIGITEMFGYKCPENFNYPYITDSVTKFWRRWHITLSGWFRDYIYIPLGGSRNKQRWKVYCNLFIVWLLTGIWHGAAWNFIAWGLGYFVVISLEKLLNFPGRLKTRIGKVIYRIFTLLFINFQWVLFNSTSLISGLRFIKRMILFYPNELTDMRTSFLLRDYGFFIIIAIILSVPVVPWIGCKLKDKKSMYTVYEVLLSLIIIGAFIWSISFIVAGQNNPFAYANF
ncbi:MAG: MBOAT family O-acyltransferase, partial [Faecousia sp.]